MLTTDADNGHARDLRVHYEIQKLDTPSVIKK